MASSSSIGGQGALRQLPSPSDIPKHPLASLTLPPTVRSERKTLSSSNVGIEVYKVSRVRDATQHDASFIFACINIVQFHSI